jgi:hypothetical protein
MIPTFANLSGYMGKTISMDIELKLRGADVPTKVLERSWGATLNGNGNSLSLSRNDATGEGLWVPYAEGEAVLGYFKAQTWFASGPFSGCKLVLGKCKRDGRLFGAHLAKASGVDSAETEEFYMKYRQDNDLSEFYFNRIPIPNQFAFSCSYVFVVLNGTGIVSMSRMDVNVTQMGGSNGTISHVHQFK